MKQILTSILLLTGAAVAQTSFASAADAVRPSLVSIVTEKAVAAGARDTSGAGQSQELGSGFVIDTLGHILTCNHVVANYEEVTVRFSDDKTYDGNDVVVVGVDPVTDLAVVQVKAKREFTPATLGNSAELEVGQPVMAMGSPFGLEGTATAGIVSGLSRWGLAKSTGPDFQDFIQTDALINPGNSGGPLIDLQGRVVGVNSFIRTQRSGPTGIGFATPISLAKSVADQIIKDGKVTRGFLGISSQPITEGIRQALGLRTLEGVLVSFVEPGRPGDRAGIEPGDAILTIDGKSIPDVRWFQGEVARRAPGSSLRFGLVRKGRALTVSAVLEAWPAVLATPTRTPVPANWLGLTLSDATKAASGERDFGIVIAGVEDGSPAMAAGLRPGDIVTEINLAPVRTVADFEKIKQAMAGSKRPLLFRAFRGREAFYAAVKP